MACSARHGAAPVLSAFGRAFKAGGYTLAAEEQQQGGHGAGDPGAPAHPAALAPAPHRVHRALRPHFPGKAANLSLPDGGAAFAVPTWILF